MSTPSPSNPESESPKREEAAPQSLSPSPPSLTPLSPESASKLEPLSSTTRDEGSVAGSLPQSAIADGEMGRKETRAKPKRTRWALWIGGFLGLSVVATILGFVYVTIGTVSGTEFDAVNWTTRNFRFIRDPFSETQWTNIKHSSTRAFTVDAAIATHITGGPARPVHPRWDLVRIYRGASLGQGDALILLELLQADNAQGDDYWAEWTTDNPNAAPILWGAVRDAVHLQRYDRLPEIFDLVRVDDNPAALKPAVQKLMLAIAHEDARSRTLAGDQAAARLAALVGLSYGSSDELRALAGGD